jgi:hypothetical protein
MATRMHDSSPLSRCRHPGRGAAALVLSVTLFVVPAPALASSITTTLEGCVLTTDPRLAEAMWSAPGSFQAVAFDDEMAGCGSTIRSSVDDPYWFDENRAENTLKAWLNLENLPTCGRRQYDLHYYLDAGLLDPMGLKSLVVDTGVDCYDRNLLPQHTPPAQEPTPSVPEPGGLWLWMYAVGYAAWRRVRPGPSGLPV